MPDIVKKKTRWQIKENETFRVRFIIVDDDEGRPQVINVNVQDDKLENHWVDFNMWDYDLMMKLKRQAMRYNEEIRMFMVDSDTYNTLKIKYLLKDWSFSEGDPSMRLMHYNGVLIDESITLFNSMYPWICNVIITKMNEVLEGA